MTHKGKETTDRYQDRQTNREIEREKEREIETETDRDRDRQTDRTDRDRGQRQILRTWKGNNPEKERGA